jgi:Uma2 family endonuclease
LQLFLGALILQAATRSRLGRAATELRCVFGPRDAQRSCVPDILYVSRERMPAGNPLDYQFLPAAPDLAVVILSRGQPNQRFNRKIAFYLEQGVRLIWIVDPRTRTVTVLAPDREPRTLTAGDTLDGGEVLPGFSVPIAENFAQLDV